MDAARENRATRTFPAALAGLQAGMIAALWMLAWLGVSAAWQRTSFWTAENLMASTFWGADAIHAGFAFSTVSGAALYLAVYSLLGCALALAVRNRLPRPRLLLVSLVFALVWFYLSFHGIWKAASPLVPLLYTERPMLLGHVLFGALLARFPRYLPPAAPPAGGEIPVEAVVLAQGEAESPDRAEPAG